MKNMIHEELTLGDKVSDFVAGIVGSWAFIIIQSIIIFFWITANLYGFFIAKWDVYPFILLNLFLSFQAAYTAPVIMMSQNRMEQKDRARAIKDYETDVKAELEIEALQRRVEQLHEKVDKLIAKN
jgi:uncharacterized membrane protein